MGNAHIGACFAPFVVGSWFCILARSSRKIATDMEKSVRMRKKALFCCSTVALVFGAVYGCASGGADSLDGDLSSVSFAQIANFTGNSVMICGTRDPAADNKYPCLSELPCTCFEFAADGTLVDGTVTGLCPSVNVPAGDWTFTYEIWSGAGCTGEVLNAAGNPNNFVCYVSRTS